MDFNNKKLNNYLTQEELSNHYNKLLILCNSLNIPFEDFVYASHLYNDSDETKDASLANLYIIYSSKILSQSGIYPKIQSWIKIMNIIYIFEIKDILQIRENIPNIDENDIDKFMGIIEFFK